MTNVSGSRAGTVSLYSVESPGAKTEVSTPCGIYRGSAPSFWSTISPNRDIAIGVVHFPSRRTVTSPSPRGLQSTGNQGNQFVADNALAHFSNPKGSHREMRMSALKYS